MTLFLAFIIPVGVALIWDGVLGKYDRDDMYD